ncbi:sugar transporter [Colletotrichum lupini]|uniref:Sugar transporter n=2 Tax=Colletotrichum acutatum species complex TaxID=2707335 RepID=A0A9Q8WDL5_9PEZI|nr:sugar transporter [Colletotrichum lupini]UQC79281.1 sugar transporter [Colletotrichum lupini]
MDKLFGGNQGEADMTRMAIIRQQLGLIQGDELTKEVSMGVSEVEKA